MFDINNVIAEYIETSENRKALEKKEKELKKAIEQFNNNKPFNTDIYSVYFEARKREGLNTKELYKDFPDIKKEYGTITEYYIIHATEKAEEKTA